MKCCILAIKRYYRKTLVIVAIKQNKTKVYRKADKFRIELV